MRQFPAFIGVLAVLMCVDADAADLAVAPLADRAEALAAGLAAACPVSQADAGYNNAAALRACTAALGKLAIPFAAELAWGGDQPDKQIKKRTLTHFNSRVFQTLYLPLFGFTGRWSLDEEPRTHTPILRVEAYFRNALPPGDYPYPFWHSADKWHAYETANELRFYLDKQGLTFVVTRDAAGSEARRGPYTPVTPPAFDGAWQWRDADGQPQPHVSLFSARYSRANPFLPELDQAYRTFALRLRDAACLDCHTPSNKAEADRLVLLQTPMHAAGEIDNVIEAVRHQEMPQDDLGLRKSIPAEERAAILTAALAFRDGIGRADRWETSHLP